MNKSDIKKPSYPTFSEYQSKQIVKIAAVVGIGVSAATVSLDLEAGEQKVKESNVVEKGSEKFEKQIILLAANLGHDDFKVREQATATLISMGKKFVKEKKNEMTDFIKKELEKGKKSKDPEVKERAKKILLALTPPPPKIPVGMVDGDIAVAGEIFE